MDGPRRLAQKASLFSSSIHTQNCPGPEDVAVVRMVMNSRESHTWQRKPHLDVPSMRGRYERCATPGFARDTAFTGPICVHRAM